MEDGALQAVCTGICVVCAIVVYYALSVIKQMLDEFKKCIEEEDDGKL